MGKREKACSSTKKDHQCKESVIDIPPDDLEPVLWPDCCIYKVPSDLRKLNKETYTPQLISIGPLHHGNKKLAGMEKQKLIYRREFFEREEVGNAKLAEFESYLRTKEKDIRRRYMERSELCSNKYVNMILLDSVFIIELFIRNKKDKKYEDDYMFTKPWLQNGIQQDLLLLENQLPYFVLNDLYESAFVDNHKPTFHKLTRKYFKNYGLEGGVEIPKRTKVLHFTDLLRYFMSNTKLKPGKRSSIKNLCSAAQLHEAGVTFTVKEDTRLTEIEFDKGELKMPRFVVYDTTERVIRNIMALEQCHYPSEAYICNYIFLMDFLINTAKDVDLLVEKGVIVNWLGSNEAVAAMVNKLCLNTIESSICYQDICKRLNEFYGKPYNRTMATLWGVYFSNFWRGTSTVAAVILLLLTFLQTMSSFLALR